MGIRWIDIGLFFALFSLTIIWTIRIIISFIRRRPVICRRDSWSPCLKNCRYVKRIDNHRRPLAGICRFSHIGTIPGRRLPIPESTIWCTVIRFVGIVWFSPLRRLRGMSLTDKYKLGVYLVTCITQDRTKYLLADLQERQWAIFKRVIDGRPKKMSISNVVNAIKLVNIIMVT